MYKHIRKDTNVVFYIGIGSDIGYYRAHSNHHRNEHWHNIVNLHGYTIEIIAENVTIEEAKEMEISLISELGRCDLGKGPLTNMTNGGDGTWGHIHDEHTKEYISKRQSGDGNSFYGKKHTKLTKEKIRKKVSGTNSYWHGRKHTDVSKQKMRKRRPTMGGSDNPKAKKCIDLETNIIYGSIKELCESLHITRSIVNRLCRENRLKIV